MSFNIKNELPSHINRLMPENESESENNIHLMITNKVKEDNHAKVLYQTHSNIVSDDDNAISQLSNSDDDYPDLIPEVLKGMSKSDRQNYIVTKKTRTTRRAIYVYAGCVNAEMSKFRKLINQNQKLAYYQIVRNFPKQLRVITQKLTVKLTNE